MNVGTRFFSDGYCNVFNVRFHILKHLKKHFEHFFFSLHSYCWPIFSLVCIGGGSFLPPAKLREFELISTNVMFVCIFSSGRMTRHEMNKSRLKTFVINIRIFHIE